MYTKFRTPLRTRTPHTGHVQEDITDETTPQSRVHLNTGSPHAKLFWIRIFSFSVIEFLPRPVPPSSEESKGETRPKTLTDFCANSNMKVDEKETRSESQRDQKYKDKERKEGKRARSKASGKGIDQKLPKTSKEESRITKEGRGRECALMLHTFI